MGLGASLFLIAAGAILIWGVTGEIASLDVDAIGAILMVVGIIGLVLSMIFWSSWGGFHRRTAYVEGGPVVREAAPRRRATTVVEEEDDVAPGPPPPP